MAAGIVFSASGIALTLGASWRSYASDRNGAHIGYNSTTRRFSCGYGQGVILDMSTSLKVILLSIACICNIIAFVRRKRERSFRGFLVIACLALLIVAIYLGKELL